ncbi:MAG: flagellar hook-length control protein FliK [Salinarimonas sp.]|nr:flagellar hook-length control protein FliK [Salinarimonas sp.]
MSATLTRFDPPPADNAARLGSRSGSAQGRHGDKAGAGEEWRGPEAIAAERARREGAGDSRRETGAAGLDQAAARHDNAAARHGDAAVGFDDAAIAARMGKLAHEAGRALADHQAAGKDATAESATRAVAEALARVAPEGEEAAIAQAQDPAARFFASLERLRALAGQLDGAGGGQAASPARAGDAQALSGQAPGDPASGQSAARMQAAQARGAGTHAATMESDESLNLSLRDNPGRSGLGARQVAGIGEARVVSQATHFAPVSQSALGASNMDALAKAFDDGAAFMREAGQNGAVRGGEARGGEMRASGFDQTLAGNLRGEGARPAGPVKTLTIQLTPVSLGKISVAMHLSDGAMRMEITVADPRALEMVRADKELIGNLIRKSGLSPESITIQSGDPTQAGRQSAGGNGAGQNGNAFGQQGNGEAGSGRDSRRGGEGAPGSDPEGSIQHENAQGTRLSDGGDIYL